VQSARSRELHAVLLVLFLAISPSFGLFLVGFGVGEEPTAVVFFPELTLENLDPVVGTLMVVDGGALDVA